MPVTLETLELTPQKLESCKEAVHRMAYFNWLNAGCPSGNQLEFWVQAEQEWIQHNYVPHRMLDGIRPQPDGQSSAVSAGENRQEPVPPQSRRRKHARVRVQ